MLDQVLHGQYAGDGRCLTRTRQLKLLDWNIERGLNLSGVMDFIRREQPDVCLLQEVDLFAKRTGRRHLADFLAAEFGFNYTFGIEFEELSQGSSQQRAFHGQATLARCRLASPRILRFSRQSDVWRPRWYLPRWQVFQPRRGGRMALVTELVLDNKTVVLYNVHLESRESDDLRLWQLSEVVYDSLRYPRNTPVIVAGDLNTRRQPSPLRDYMLASGFEDACGGVERRATRPNGETLDWIFVRGPVSWSGTKVHQEVRASDHFPLSTVLSLR